MAPLGVVALVAAALFPGIVMPSSPEPSLLLEMLDDSESESTLLTISEPLFIDIFLPVCMICFPFDELID